MASSLLAHVEGSWLCRLRRFLPRETWAAPGALQADVSRSMGMVPKMQCTGMIRITYYVHSMGISDGVGGVACGMSVSGRKMKKLPSKLSFLCEPCAPSWHVRVGWRRGAVGGVEAVNPGSGNGWEAGGDTRPPQDLRHTRHGRRGWEYGGMGFFGGWAGEGGRVAGRRACV